MMAPPLFPIAYDALKSEIEFRDFKAGEILTPVAGVTVRTMHLNHPNGATGYRLEYDGRSVAYITDNESKTAAPDGDLVSFLAGVDVLIYDCTYTDEEVRSHIGWGHSSWQQGLSSRPQPRPRPFASFTTIPTTTMQCSTRLQPRSARCAPAPWWRAKA